jgi:hypothetical protein
VRATKKQLAGMGISVACADVSTFVLGERYIEVVCTRHPKHGGDHEAVATWQHLVHWPTNEAAKEKRG